MKVELLEHLPHVIEHAFMITGFVFVMMLVIEFINIQTRAFGKKDINSSSWIQYIVAGILGVIPGCLGAFSAVGLFSHGILSFGALVTAMIATSGDEAFLMLAMFPGKAILLFAVMFVISIFAGKLTDRVFAKATFADKLKHRSLPLHEGEKCFCFSSKEFFRNFSFRRIIILVLVGLVILFAISGLRDDHNETNNHAHEQIEVYNEDCKHHQEHTEEHDKECEHRQEHSKHEEGTWVFVTILITAIAAFIMVLASTEHFLKEHLWDHIVKVHIIKIFIWTFVALLAVQILMHFTDVNSWISGNLVILLLIACIVGLIPESGPHIIFVTLFFEGTIPFSILLASSIVQDGHGMLPLLAESKRSFIYVKIINLLIGLIIGFVALKAGF